MDCYYYPYPGIFNNLENNSDLVCYPNPAKTSIYVKMNSNEHSEATIEIFNLLGQKADENNVNQTNKNSFSTSVIFQMGAILLDYRMETKPI